MSLRPHRFINDYFSGHLVAVYSSGADGRLRRWRLDSGLNPRWPRNFIIVPRNRTVTKYTVVKLKIEKLSVVTGDRTHNLHLPRLAYIPLVHLCASYCRNKLYICMNHYCTEGLAIFSHYQNPTCSLRNIDPDLRSGFQSGSRPILNSVFLWSLPPYSPNFTEIRPVVYGEILLTNKQTNKHTKVIGISRFSRDNKKSSWYSPPFAYTGIFCEGKFGIFL